MLSTFLWLFRYFKAGDFWILGPLTVTAIVVNDIRNHAPLDLTTGLLVVVMLVTLTMGSVLHDLIDRAKRAA